MAVSEMPPVRQIHTKDHIAGLNHRSVCRLIGLRTGMRGDIYIFMAEEVLSPLARQSLDSVREFASSVVALAGVTLGVFIGENGPSRLQNSLGGEVFAGD